MVSISIVQNSHKAVSPILHFKRYLLVGIIRIKHLKCILKILESDVLSCLKAIGIYFVPV